MFHKDKGCVCSAHFVWPGTEHLSQQPEKTRAQGWDGLGTGGRCDDLRPMELSKEELSALFASVQMEKIPA